MNTKRKSAFYFFIMTQTKTATRIGIAVACLGVAGLGIFLFVQKNKENALPEFLDNQDLVESEAAHELRPGSVYSEAQTPLQGAVVVVNNKKYVTKSDGSWATEGVESGTELIVLAYGYYPYQGGYDEAYPIFLTPLPSTDIAVRVHDEDGSVVNDVFVILLDSNSKEPREILRPGEDGTVTFANAPTGDTILFAIKKGYHLGWSMVKIDEANNAVSILIKKRIPFAESEQKPDDQESLTKRPQMFRFVDVANAQDAGEEFEQAFPDEYRLMIERDENAAAVEGIELSPDDVADALSNDPNKKDWKSLGAEHLQFSDDIPEGYSLQRKMVNGKEVFVVESDIYTDSVQQKMFGMGVDYGELSVEAQARRKLAAESGGRPSFQTSLFWNWDKVGSREYVEGLYDTGENPVNNPYSPVMQEGGMTRPATLYDKDGNPVTTPEVLQEFLHAAKQIHEGNPQFSLTVNGSKEPTVVVGEPFTLEAEMTLNHELFPGWYILSPAAIHGYFESRWINNPTQKFRGTGKIMPYLVQNAPPRHTQFTNTYTERREFSCLELGEETITYSFEVSYRFAQKNKDSRGLVEPGSSHYTYRVPMNIRCVGPELMSRKAPDKCGNPATAVISGRVGGEHVDILESVEVYIAQDEGAYTGSTYASIDGSGSFEANVSLSPGFYYYWVFGHTANGHFYLLDEFEGSIEIKEKEEGKEGCEEEEEEQSYLEDPIKTPPQPSESSGCGSGGSGGGVLWVCPR